jgi:AcrR family transcriptional regulator
VKRKNLARRLPRQKRAQETVDAVLDSVAKLLKRGGVQAVTTNRIAEVAGVSIGSLYQYFPNKEAIFSALHDRHIEAMGRIVEANLVRHAASSPDDLVRALVEAMIAAHTSDPELHELLFTQVPHGPAAGGRDLDVALQRTLRLAIDAQGRAKSPADRDRMLFALTHMVEALTHGAVLARPPRVSLAAATDESVRATLAYLHAS